MGGRLVGRGYPQDRDSVRELIVRMEIEGQSSRDAARVGSFLTLCITLPNAQQENEERNSCGSNGNAFNSNTNECCSKLSGVEKI